MILCVSIFRQGKCYSPPSYPSEVWQCSMRPEGLEKVGWRLDPRLNHKRKRQRCLGADTKLVAEAAGARCCCSADSSCWH
jgi:hypothetical protein